MASLEHLEAAGFDVTNATDEQRAVLESLTDEELQVLVSVRDRLDEATDVEAHTYPSGGWCW